MVSRQWVRIMAMFSLGFSFCSFVQVCYFPTPVVRAIIKKGFSPLKCADWLIMRWIKPQKQPKDFLKGPVLSAHFGRICSVVFFFPHWTTKDIQGCGSFIKDGVSESWRMTSTIQLSSEQHWQYLFYTSSLQNEQQLGWRRCWLPDVRIFGCKSRHLQSEHVGVFEADEFGQDGE